jgi:hypothetical protein
VGGRRQQVDPHRLDVHRDLAHRLGGVGVEDDAALLGQRADGRDVLDGPDLVVGEHDRDQDGLVGHRSADLVHVDEAVRLHGHVRHLEARALQALADVDARPLLDHGGDDVRALLAVHLGHALEGQVDRLRPPGREHQLLGVAGPDEPGQPGAGGVDRGLGLPSERVITAGRMAELLGEVGQHRLHHARIARRRGLRVHEDRELQRHRSETPPVRP